MSFQWGNTSYTEFISEKGLGASPKISLANDASWATRILDIDWLWQVQAADDFIGYPTIQSSGLTFPLPTGWINRNIPMPFPFYKEQIVQTSGSLPKYSMYCTKINSVQGVGFAGWSVDGQSQIALATYKTARMELGFESLPYDILEDGNPAVVSTPGFPFPDEASTARYVTKIPGPSADYITLNQGILYYAEGPLGPPNKTAVPFGPGKILVSSDLRYRWELVPKDAVPSIAVNPQLVIGPPGGGGNAAIEYTLGRVNQNWFPPNPPNTGYPPGTLLLTAASIIPIKGVNGRRLFSVEYFIKFLPVGHHKIFGPATGLTGAFVEASTDGQPHPITPTTPDGVHIYDVADFSWLFRPPLNLDFTTVLKAMPPPSMQVVLRSVPTIP